MEKEKDALSEKKIESDELIKIKQDLMDELNKIISGFNQFLEKLPENKMKTYSILNFDQGFLWAREMILTQLQLKKE